MQHTTEPLRISRGALIMRIDKLEEATEPLLRGDLVRIQTDVSWIRQRLQRQAR